MKSARLGESASAPEVTNVSQHGFWMLIDGREKFLPFRDFPWFADATIAQLARIERPHAHHLYWPDLDVDLHLDSIDRPEAYPHVANAPAGAPRSASATRKPGERRR
jgi:hypothetical protein